MLEESLPSVWASMSSWFTPALLFVLLNIVIGTIVIASGVGTQNHQEQQPQLARAPSVLHRLKSINPYYYYRSEEVENPFPTTTTILQQSEVEQVEDTQQTVEPTHEQSETMDQNPYEVANAERHVTRSKSDTKPASGDMPVKLPQKLKKSASAKSAFGHFEEEEMVERRPSTVKEGKSKAGELQGFGDDEGVDAKADDFINRFKQQLKLQRLDSIIRYKDMLRRGGK